LGGQWGQRVGESKEEKGVFGKEERGGISKVLNTTLGKRIAEKGGFEQSL